MNDVLKRTLGRMLMLIAAVSLRYGLKLKQLNDLLKVALVEAATREAKAQQLQPSVSRISAMTGVHRKDATKIIEAGAPPKVTINPLVKMISAWKHQPHYLSSEGTPRLLSYRGLNSELMQLVAKFIGADLSPYTVLGELQRLKIIKLHEDRDQAELIGEVLIDTSQESALNYLSQDVSDLGMSVLENIDLRESRLPNLHLTTSFDNINPESIPEIRQWLLEEGSRFHEKVRNYLAKFDLDLNPQLNSCRGDSNGNSKHPVRVVVGSFSYASQG